MDSTLALIRQPVNQAFPAGFFGSNVEIFTTGDKNYAKIDGNQVEFSDWPDWLKAELLFRLKSDPKAVKGLMLLGIYDEADQIWQFARCRRGGLDRHPDFVDGQLVGSECWDCGIQGKCKAEGLLCTNLQMPAGHITPREMQVWKLVVTGLLDKEIADRLNMAPTTVPQHVRKLSEKCGVRNRADLVRVGCDFNILQ